MVAQDITAEGRKDKIAALRQAVGEDTYRVKASETAAKIINRRVQVFLSAFGGLKSSSRKLIGPLFGPALEETSQPKMINQN